ncbi:MAG: acetyl-CoA carboxylase carboxyltransferase subunit beta [Lachnospiraceae bacterium]|nr:acetyl-CoA carboxylase carboxyltransferase subunit beta [Lachnospiraceae bacterium]MDY5743013.1 acetyl-CoA carboxylase carboxyltransferase subunit beta [Lachnospiraceae bacterium]
MIKDIFKKKGYEAVGEMRIDDGMVVSCRSCRHIIFREELADNSLICPHCGEYFTMGARERIRLLVGEENFQEYFNEIYGGNPLDFPDYEMKLQKAALISKEQEAIITGTAKIGRAAFVLGVMDSRFLMASMGAAVGEKVTKAFELSVELHLPIVLVICSGGARMQEGMHSLMQMAKTAQAVTRHREAGLLYVAVLTNPTMGGVSASYASMADIILAEKGAMIGFAGARVIEQTTGEKLPKGFQQSEFLLDHGMVDEVVERSHLRKTLYALLRLHEKGAVTQVGGHE